MKICCPTCSRTLENVPANFPHRPFCSNRCKMVDLGRWLNEDYCISEELPFATSTDSSDASAHDPEQN